MRDQSMGSRKMMAAALRLSCQNWGWLDLIHYESDTTMDSRLNDHKTLRLLQYKCPMIPKPCPRHPSEERNSKSLKNSTRSISILPWYLV